MNETEFLARVDRILDSVEAQADTWFENLTSMLRPGARAMC